ncbi:hypothetical protein NQ318_021609 [Aromia moschata]|uniref:SCP domain-containing protein n=1 Tax=Aromia moschata TaxID=1265417 RepID=A0AAV8YJL6_9CUCU|nr:hypothetical protein NQ318_021609 [Aromia moschata]
MRIPLRILLSFLFAFDLTDAGCDKRWPSCRQRGVNTVCLRGEDCSPVGGCRDLGGYQKFRQWMTEKHNELRNHIATVGRFKSTSDTSCEKFFKVRCLKPLASPLPLRPGAAARVALPKGGTGVVPKVMQKLRISVLESLLPKGNCSMSYVLRTPGNSANNDNCQEDDDIPKKYSNLVRIVEGGGGNSNDTRGGNSAAANMNAVSYDLDLEYVSQCHINMCEFEHDKCRLTPKFKDTSVGQNLYTGSYNLGTEEGLKHAVQAW